MNNLDLCTTKGGDVFRASKLLFAPLFVVGGTFLLLFITPIVTFHFSDLLDFDQLASSPLKLATFITSIVFIIKGLIQMGSFEAKSITAFKVLYGCFLFFYLFGYLVGCIPGLGGMLKSIFFIVAFLFQLVAIILLLVSNTFSKWGYLGASLWVLVVLFSIVMSVLQLVQIFGTLYFVERMVYPLMYFFVALFLFLGVVQQQKVTLKLKGTRKYMLFALFAMLTFWSLYLSVIGQTKSFDVMSLIFHYLLNIVNIVVTILLAVYFKSKVRMAMIVKIFTRCLCLAIILWIGLGLYYHYVVFYSVLNLIFLMLLFNDNTWGEKMKVPVQMLLLSFALSFCYFIEIRFRLTQYEVYIAIIVFKSLSALLVVLLELYAWRKIAFLFLEKEKEILLDEKPKIETVEKK
jgi:hypothetical protein